MDAESDADANVDADVHIRADLDAVSDAGADVTLGAVATSRGDAVLKKDAAFKGDAVSTDERSRFRIFSVQWDSLLFIVFGGVNSSIISRPNRSGSEERL